MIERIASAEVVGAISAGLLGAAYFFRNALTRIQKDATEGEKAVAEKSIVVQLREELDRLAGQNNLLADRLNKLQVTSVDLHEEIVLLRKENSELKFEISSLRNKNTLLHDEIVRLHDEITRLRGMANSAFGGMDDAG